MEESISQINRDVHPNIRYLDMGKHKWRRDLGHSCLSDPVSISSTAPCATQDSCGTLKTRKFDMA